MAHGAVARGVRGPAQGRHRASVHGRVHRRHHRGRVRVPGVRRRALPLRHEVRVPLRLAVVLRPGRHRRRRADRGPLDGHGPRRGALRALRLAPGPRLRGRGLRHAHRPALLHQLDLAQARPQGVAAPARQG
ncbi:hypothetical protein SBRY_60345 [Actinacidiphila bryophytorum]|uniref:Uncharacterized protein n=1 Tax=Actinacidiphila bryophytorum TaxID=1436133 RepID=A0A9W4H6E9_9ACTN|nr:hypothetical protein SBRY_60345 [Actinacidiphila bryophytorum]